MPVCSLLTAQFVQRTIELILQLSPVALHAQLTFENRSCLCKCCSR